MGCKVYSYVEPKQKTCWTRQEFLSPPSTSSRHFTYSVYGFWSSHAYINDLEAHSSALIWTVSFVESFTGALKLLDTTSPSSLLRLQELPLSVALYSITPSALVDRLWSLSCSSFILYIYIYIYTFFEKRDIY